MREFLGKSSAENSQLEEQPPPGSLFAGRISRARIRGPDDNGDDGGDDERRRWNSNCRARARGPPRFMDDVGIGRVTRRTAAAR